MLLHRLSASSADCVHYRIAKLWRPTRCQAYAKTTLRCYAPAYVPRTACMDLTTPTTSTFRTPEFHRFRHSLPTIFQSIILILFVPLGPLLRRFLRVSSSPFHFTTFYERTTLHE